MNRKILLLGWVLIFCFQANSQSPGELLDRWSAKTPIEKVYLHFDRENYIAGETAWFKAYTYSDYQPDTISTSLFVELVHYNGTRITTSIVPILLGVATGQLDIPDSLGAGNYLVRAFSPTMLNIDTTFTGRQTLFIYGRRKNNPPALDRRVRLEFFPEGGNLITGFTNSVAFKATDERGLPVTVKGKVSNEKNEEVTRFASVHDGMGSFELNTKAGEKYYGVADDDATATNQYLPGQTENGIALIILPHPQGHFFEIQQKTSDPLFRVAYMIGQMQHHTVFRQDFKDAKESFQGVINTQRLHSGILQVTFFNANHQPLAERLCFVNNKEYILPGVLFTDSLNFSERAKNRLSIQLKDTIRGNFSVSVSDADYALNETRDENIYSSLLMSSDLKGYIHRPSYYFSADNDSVRTALDLVMMTNGWRRFKWEELQQKAIKPLYKDGSFITLAGKISLRGVRKPFDEKPLMLMMVTEDSTRRVQMLTTDKQGRFKLDSMLFFGKTRLLFGDIRGKKSQYIDAHLDPDSLNQNYKLPPISIPSRNDRLLASSQSKIDMDYEAIYKARGLMMEGVTVKARKKTPLELLEEKYATGGFSNDARKTFDLVNSDEGNQYRTVWEYLAAKGYAPGSRGMATVSALGQYNTEIFLDEFLADVEYLDVMPFNKVAMIKIFTTFSGSAGGGPGGMIAIYTKKGEDLWNSIDARPSSVRYNGYSINKEFYAPDYSVKQVKKEADNRITIDWRPDIFVNNVNPRIPFSFYNNDRTKKYKVVVEGMTFDGRMLMIERIIKP